MKRYCIIGVTLIRVDIKTKPKKKMNMFSLSFSLSLKRHFPLRRKREFRNLTPKAVSCIAVEYIFSLFQFMSKRDSSIGQILTCRKSQSFLHDVLQVLYQNTVPQSEHSQSWGNDPDLISNSGTVGTQREIAD